MSAPRRDAGDGYGWLLLALVVALAATLLGWVPGAVS